jgi:ribulose kinase
VVHQLTIDRNAGHSITEMCVSGSQALNGPLLQLIANVCRLPVAAPTQPALSVVSGSAQLARYAVEVRLQEGTFEASVALNKAMKHRDLLWRCMVHDAFLYNWQSFLCSRR